MKLLIVTQVYENYAWREDGSIGKGEDAYWKAKGGDEYVVYDIFDAEDATTAVMCLRKDIEKDTDYYREQVIDWQLMDNEELTPFERDQLEYEGRIVYPAKELTWA
jgi:hypothetical protein